MVAHGSTYRIKTPVGDAYITINTNGNREPVELFINVGKAGSDVYAMAEGLGRMISLMFRVSSYLSPVERIRKIVDELSNIGGAQVMGFGKDRVRSLPDAVAKVLTAHYELKKESVLLVNNKNGKAALTNGQVNGKILEENVFSDAEEVDQAKGQEMLFSPLGQTSFEHAHFDICSDCGVAALVYEEGCKKCYSCGYSAC
jgi:ribonucleoside-diphosphate reductase alpha chain